MEYSISIGIQVTEAIDMKYVDRGHAGAPDFVNGDFTKGPPTELDLSGIVPEAGANHLVHLSVELDNTTNPSEAAMFGKVNPAFGAPFPNSSLSEPVANQAIRATDMWVMMDGNRHIEYIISGSTTIHWLHVRGWWTD